jgi:hypothetical protein
MVEYNQEVGAETPFLRIASKVVTHWKKTGNTFVLQPS